MKKVIYNENGDVMCIWGEHKELNPETGEMESKSPPQQPGEYGRSDFQDSEIPEGGIPAKVDDIDNPSDVIKK